MTLKIIRTLPDTSSWVPLSEHQGATPASFSTPVLHFQSLKAKLALSSDQKWLLPAFFPDAQETTEAEAAESMIPGSDTAQNGTAEGDEEDWEDEDGGPMIQDVFVENVNIYNTSE